MNIIQAVHNHIHMLLKPLFGYDTGQAYGEHDAVIFPKHCIHRGIADEHCGNWGLRELVLEFGSETIFIYC